MNCERPLLAVRMPGVNKENGHAIIKILPMASRPDWNMATVESRYGADNVLRLPCGRCAACKEAYRADWSIRCDMEARYHTKNVFLTLTYRSETCPRWVSKGHVRKFIRKLRSSLNNQIMYFACGEYGETNGRPHYHVIIFGWFPDDAVLKEAKSKSGFDCYESKFLTDLWDKGFVEVNNFSQDTAFYVAGYVNKKTGKYDGFLMQSNGIGYQYMMDHIKELFNKRTYIARNGRVHFVPRAFKRVCEKLGYYSEEDPNVISNMRKMENGEILSRGLTRREQLMGITSMKMKDKLEKRSKRL